VPSGGADTETLCWCRPGEAARAEPAEPTYDCGSWPGNDALKCGDVLRIEDPSRDGLLVRPSARASPPLGDRTVGITTVR